MYKGPSVPILHPLRGKTKTACISFSFTYFDLQRSTTARVAVAQFIELCMNNGDKNRLDAISLD
ncbi:hypothetical protein CFIMG_000701RAa [Ceratocystis fimbriata CBS 114723]|uniref:Uncharacterized protein n=1 Tax=Ceratocystis fimbriata CBS 114723 TaxID=1035309 RepID=A0A2C5WZZ4_9PEZI|nr:hypothetical protein CFIMG_000701RAa [Ceratocystis fimbriata CBS 114723]